MSARYLRHLLIERAEWMERRIISGATSHGYGHLTPALIRMFSVMGGRPVGLSELARRLVISRQAIHVLAKQAEELGLVELVPSESDRRVMLIRFSQKGWDMSDAVGREMSRIEAEIAASIGEQALATLKDLLAAHWGDEEEAGDGETGDNAFDKNSRRVAPLHSVLRAAMGSTRRG
ncbi:MAG: winged helix-turn-helix transcriptional regulator [Notoacmeibacter sp.]|nr:winged helix-turn-helix transcriptional regulator [Notoacmeibacter sp.]MCC0032027.1 winged helix-turn-helix transcriptional regulator [Brucellaceae bacterium]